MIIILSPAKTLDFKSEAPMAEATEPRLTDRSVAIMKKLSTLSRKSLMELMDISQALADENRQRFAEWTYPFPDGAWRQAIFAFKGDAYLGFDAASMSGEELTLAQGRLRILSGLHGLLRPLDKIMPYRLEMGTRLPVGLKKDLYQFWGGTLSELLSEDMKAAGTDVLINLASKEYYDAITPVKAGIRVITPVFRDFTKGKYRFVSFNAKRARGAMSSWIIRNRLSEPEGIKAFDGLGYAYNDRLSRGDEWYFTKD